MGMRNTFFGLEGELTILQLDDRTGVMATAQYQSDKSDV